MKKALITAAATMCVLPVFADDLNQANMSDWYFSPMGSYIHSGTNYRNEDNGNGARLMIGKKVSERFNLEMGPEYNRFDRDLISNTNLEQYGFKVNSLLFFNRQGLVAPYLSTGLGIYDTPETDDTNPQYSIGLGMMSKVSFFQNALLRTEITFQQEIDSSDLRHDNFKVGLGLKIPFKRTAMAITPKDSDRDGVLDGQDACPNTPIGTAVNSRGCKLERDSDNDGVVDSIDQCPGTLAGRVVDAKGCALPIDSDKDGVTDNIDQCPNTAKGERVDFKGCKIDAVITLPEVNFEFNSAQLKTSSYITLDGAVATMKKYDDIRAIVAGHTDSVGNDAYNLNLSERRASSVRDYMMNRGIAPSRLIARGYGETRPIRDNQTKEGRKANRRVDLDVLK